MGLLEPLTHAGWPGSGVWGCNETGGTTTSGPELACRLNSRVREGKKMGKKHQGRCAADARQAWRFLGTPPAATMGGYGGTGTREV